MQTIMQWTSGAILLACLALFVGATVISVAIVVAARRLEEQIDPIGEWSSAELDTLMTLMTTEEEDEP